MGLKCSVAKPISAGYAESENRASVGYHPVHRLQICLLVSTTRAFVSESLMDETQETKKKFRMKRTCLHAVL